MNFWNDIKHFKPSEFDSPDSEGSGVNMKKDFIFMLEELRRQVGEPVRINSGFRTEAYNASLKNSSKYSSHLIGRAADIHVTRKNVHKFVKAALAIGFTGIGIKRKSGDEFGFIHLDDKPRSSIWTY